MSAGAKFQEPEVLDPAELADGDQVACTDAGPRLRPMVGEAHGEDPIWLTLGGEEHQRLSWHHGWTLENLPRVLARRAIA